MGAPEKMFLNAAGRPIRQAAAKSKYSRVHNVSSETEVKPPWLQADQDPDDEDETWLPFVARLAPVGGPDPEAALHRDAQDPAAAPDPAHLQQVDTPDQDQAPAQLLQAAAEVNLDSGEDEQPPTEDGAAVQSGSEANTSTDGSEYYDVPTNRGAINQEEDYDWDEHEESLSFTASEAEAGQPTLPPGWPPRRLSSECSNQMIVTQLAPTNSNFETYFEDTAFENNRMLASSSVTPHQQTDKSPQLMVNLPVADVTVESEDPFSGSDPEFHLSDVSDPEETAGAILLPSGQEQADPAHTGQRHSSRIRNSARPDYRSLHSKGRTSNL